MLNKLWEEEAPFATGNQEEDSPVITSYPVESSEQVGAVIVFPGGGYQMRAEHEGAPIARWLNTIGISAFVVSYRVAPYKHPVPLLDAQRAIRYVRYHAKRWNINGSKIGILGFYAGCHLVSTAGTHYDSGDSLAVDLIERESCRPDAMILCYPVISFMEHYHEGSMLNLLGENPDELLRLSLSNEKCVTAETPPAFIWHTADDSAVPVENSLNLAIALSQYKVPYDLHIYESGTHGLGLAEEDEHVRTWSHICGLWLKKQGF
jgi:acetyl esterase/lipase